MADPGQSGNGTKQMTIRNSTRAGACLVAIMAVLGTMPAHAEVNVTLGGFLAMETLYRSRSETADIGSSFNAIPFSNQPTGHMSELRGSARQSRLSLLVQGDADADTHLAAYYEMDFLGGAQTANSNESNSYNLRIRNIYATIDWDSLGLEILAGQNWSLATLNSKGITPRNEVPPPRSTPNMSSASTGPASRRSASSRTGTSSSGWLCRLRTRRPPSPAMPAPHSGVTTTTTHAGGSLLANVNNFSLNHIPDFIGKVVWEPVIDGSPTAAYGSAGHLPLLL